MTDPFPNFTTDSASHISGCETKGCTNTKKFKEKFCTECKDKDKLSKELYDIQELAEIINRKKIEYNNSPSTLRKDEIVMLKEILVVLKQKIKFDSDSVTDNRKMYYGKTHHDGTQVLLETHCTIVRIPDSPDNVYFGHVTLEITYNDSNGKEQKPKWHFGAKVINDFPKKLKHTFWKHSQQEDSFYHHDFVGKYGTFTTLDNNVQLSDIMSAHFTKCYEFFTTKKRWKQVWQATDVIENENANDLLNRLKQQKQARETIDFQMYEKRLEQFKEREHHRKVQAREEAQAEIERELQEKAGLDAAVQLQEQIDREYREDRERQLPQEQEPRQPLALFHEWTEKSKSEDSSTLQKKIKEQQDAANRLLSLQKQTRKEQEARKAEEEARKAEEEARKARLLRIRQHNLLTKQQQEKLEKEQKDRQEEVNSAFLEKEFQKNKVKSIEQKETVFSEMEELLKRFNLMSEDAYILIQQLSKIYDSHIIELSSKIEGIHSNESLNSTDKQEFLDILEKKREDTEYLLDVVSSKGRAYKLYLKIQEIERDYRRSIIPTEKNLKTLRYEDEYKVQLTRRFLINYYQKYEDLDSDSQSLRNEERIHIRDKLEKLSKLVNHRKRLTELCTEEAPFIIEYYRIHYDIFDEDDEFIIRQIRILIPFLDKEMANDIVERARRKNGGILTTKYIIENNFPEGFYILDPSENERLLDLFPARRIMVNQYNRYKSQLFYPELEWL